jgi:hypothetical protein
LILIAFFCGAPWVAQMTDYRVYIIGEDGRFVRAIELDCQDDDAAIESAKQLIEGQDMQDMKDQDMELWQRDRRIAKFRTGAQDE